MRIFDAEPQIVDDLRSEGNLISEKQYPEFKVSAVRHPTLGRIVIIEGPDGSGAIVETDE